MSLLIKDLAIAAASVPGSTGDRGVRSQHVSFGDNVGGRDDYSTGEQSGNDECDGLQFG